MTTPEMKRRSEDDFWKTASIAARKIIKDAGATGVIMSEGETNIGLAQRDYKQKCVTDHVEKLNVDCEMAHDAGCTDPNCGRCHQHCPLVYAHGAIALFRGYWIWWCKTHYQPLSWCTRGILEEQVESLKVALDVAEKSLDKASFENLKSREKLHRIEAAMK
jgi:hypothetical protein